MRAVAASRKLGKRTDNSNLSGTNGGASLSGARQKIASQRSSSQRRTGYSSTSLYTSVPTTSPSDPGLGKRETTDFLPTTSSMVTSRSRVSMAPPGTNKQEGRKSATPPERNATVTPMGSRSLDIEDAKLTSPPTSAIGNGPFRKNLKDDVPRTVSNLSRAPSSVATTNIGAASKVESKLGARRKAIEKRYYAKAMGLMSGGGLIFTIGIVLAVLYFVGYENLMMAGPIVLSIGLLLLVCGIVWIPIIKTKLKRKQQIMSRTFSL